MIDISQEEIMKNWYINNSNNPLVSIRCITYNHEPYIVQALDGFLMQKTTFPFEIVVHDDASTDRTADIIREYQAKFPKIIKPIYEIENQYSKHDGSLDRIMIAACKGKYIAFCEGDDYWIDENKIQMQVDFLENNSDYGICYTKANVYIQKSKTFRKKAIGSIVNDFDDLLQNTNRIPTLTTCIRKQLYNEYLKDVQPQNKEWKMGDYPIWLYISYNSKIKFFDLITSVYRVLDNSASHSNDLNRMFLFEKSVDMIRIFYSKKYKVNIEVRSDDYIWFYVYVNSLRYAYNKEKALLLKTYYKKLDYKNIKMHIYNVFATYQLFWNVLRLFQ